jgi:hypothetical protein
LIASTRARILPVDTGRFVNSQRLRLLAACVEAIELAVILGRELLHEIGVHEVGLEPGEHAGLQHVPTDCEPVVARPPVARVRATVVVRADLGKTAAAAATLD